MKQVLIRSLVFLLSAGQSLPAFAQAPGRFSTVTITSTAADAIKVGTASMGDTDLNKIDGITNGTAAAGKAVVLDSNGAINILRTASLRIGTSGSETTVTSTGAELNYLAGITCGTVTASKALCVDANKDLATLRNVTLSGTFNATGVGPHAVGGTTVSSQQFTIKGTFAERNGFLIESTIQPPANAGSAIAYVAGTIAEAASGTHALLAGLRVDAPTVIGAAGLVTDTATFYITQAASATVSGANYALWVDSGNARFDGDIIGSFIGTTGATSFNVYTNGSTRWYWNSAGHYIANGAYNIGDGAGNSPAIIYAETGIYAGSYVRWDGTSSIFAPSDGVISLYDNAQTSFNRLQFGGTSSSYPALKRSSADLHLVFADGTSGSSFQAFNVTATNALVAGTSAAATGNVRLPNNTYVRWRNAANNDQYGLYLSSSDVVTSEVRFEAPSFTTGSCVWRSGSGSPESVITGNVCDTYTRTNGGAGSTFYVKESGTGNTGWVAK